MKKILQELINENLTQREIATKMNMSQSSITLLLKKHSLKTNRAPTKDKYSSEEERKAAKKKAYINNFRMKRGEPFKTDNFNTTVLKTDNLKIVITV